MSIFTNIFYPVRTEDTCTCYWSSWRDARACDMHLKAGYGMYHQFKTGEQ